MDTRTVIKNVLAVMKGTLESSLNVPLGGMSGTAASSLRPAVNDDLAEAMDWS